MKNVELPKVSIDTSSIEVRLVGAVLVMVCALLGAMSWEPEQKRVAAVSHHHSNANLSNAQVFEHAFGLPVRRQLGTDGRIGPPLDLGELTCEPDVRNGYAGTKCSRPAKEEPLVP